MIREVVVKQFDKSEFIGIQDGCGIRRFYCPGDITHTEAAATYPMVVLGSQSNMHKWVNGNISLKNVKGDIIHRVSTTIELIDIRPGIGTLVLVRPDGNSFASCRNGVTLRTAVAEHISRGTRVFLKPDEPPALEHKTIVHFVRTPISASQPIVAMKGSELVIINDPSTQMLEEQVMMYRFTSKIPLHHGWKIYALRSVTSLEDSVDITNVIEDHDRSFASPSDIYLPEPGLVILVPNWSPRITYHRGGLVEVSGSPYEKPMIFADARECAEYYIACGVVVQASVVSKMK